MGAESALQEMERESFSANLDTYSSMINGYTKKGMLVEAVDVMRKMKEEKVDLNIVTYATLIDGLFKMGNQEAARHIQRDA